MPRRVVDVLKNSGGGACALGVEVLHNQAQESLCFAHKRA